MKTQLLEDFDESGSAAQARQAEQDARAAHADGSAPPAGAADPSRQDEALVAPNAAPAAQAAVWHRPQADLDTDQTVVQAGQSMQGGVGGATAPGPFAQMRPPGGDVRGELRGELRYGAAAQRPEQAAQARQRAPAGAWAGTRPVPPEARAAAGADTQAQAPAHAHVDTHAEAHAHAQARAHAGTQAAHDLPPKAERPAARDPMPDPAPTAANEIPDWLAERLRADAEEEAQRQRSRLMTRRAFAWSGAATVVAMLAVTAYWFYQDNAVEGALHVVAKTSPAPPARSPAAPGAGRAAVLPSAAAPAAVLPSAAPPAAQDAPAMTTPAPAAAAPAPAPADTSVNVRADTRAEDQAAAPSAPSVPDATASAMQSPASATQPPASAAQPPAAATGARAHGQVTHKRVRHTRHDTTLANIDGPLRPSGASAHAKRSAPEPAPRPRAEARSDAEPTPAQRREETLMQCRVLGYDERECTRRGCMMTRFGLACPG